jgi:tetratricopeptide (TPR) repeat protein
MKLRSIYFALTIVLFSSCTSEPAPQVAVTESNIDSLIQAHPDSIALLLQRGEFRFNQYEYDLALQDVAKAFRLDTNNVESRLWYAEVINNRETRTPDDVATAQRMYLGVIKKDQKNLRALVGVASTYTYQADFEKSFEYINQALRVDKHYRNAYVLKGTNYWKMGNTELAKSSYETAVQQDPEFFEAYFLLGQIYQSEGNPLCIEYFTTAYTLKPEVREARYQLAFSKQIHGDIVGAQQLYREMASDTVDFYVTRGLFHQAYIKQFEEKDLDSAMYFYRSALQTEPRHVESWHNLGVCYDEQGDKTRALQSFSKALKYNPDFELSRNYADSIRLL